MAKCARAGCKNEIGTAVYTDEEHVPDMYCSWECLQRAKRAAVQADHGHPELEQRIAALEKRIGITGPGGVLYE